MVTVVFKFPLMVYSPCLQTVDKLHDFVFTLYG